MRERGVTPSFSALALLVLATSLPEFVGTPFTRAYMSPCFTRDKTRDHLLPRPISKLPAVYTTLSPCTALPSQAEKKVREQHRMPQRIDPLVARRELSLSSG